jgi:hypothetical protein
MKFLILSLCLHLALSLLLFIPKGFDVLVWLGLKTPSVHLIVQRSMRVDILDLPELEKLIGKTKHTAVPQKKSTKKENIKIKKKRKSKKKKQHDKKSIQKSKEDILANLRKRAGNILQEGQDALSPAIAIAHEAFEGDPFWLSLEHEIKKNWNVPPHLKQDMLAVTYTVKISSEGEITSIELIEASNSQMYDEFVSGFLSGQLFLDLEIPYRFKEVLSLEGVRITFTP